MDMNSVKTGLPMEFNENKTVALIRVMFIDDWDLWIINVRLSIAQYRNCFISTHLSISITLHQKEKQTKRNISLLISQYLSTKQIRHLSIYVSIFLATYQSIHISIYLSFYLSIYLSVSLYQTDRRIWLIPKKTSSFP